MIDPWQGYQNSEHYHEFFQDSEDVKDAYCLSVVKEGYSWQPNGRAFNSDSEAIVAKHDGDYYDVPRYYTFI